MAGVLSDSQEGGIRNGESGTQVRFTNAVLVCTTLDVLACATLVSSLRPSAYPKPVRVFLWAGDGAALCALPCGDCARTLAVAV